MRSPFGIIPIELFGMELQAGSIAVFAALTTFSNKDRYAFPAVEKLGTMVGMSPRMVQRHLRLLEQKNAISIVKRYDDGGRQTSNGYTLTMLKLSGGGDTHVMDGGDTHDRGEADADVTLTVQEGTVPKEQLFPDEGEGEESDTPKPKRACQLPDGWMPSGHLIEWAGEKHPTVDADAEFLQFQDFHIAKGSKFKDWDAAFRTWVRNAEKFNTPRSGQTPQSVAGHRGVVGRKQRRMDLPPA